MGGPVNQPGCKHVPKALGMLCEDCAPQPVKVMKEPLSEHTATLHMVLARLDRIENKIDQLARRR